MARSAWVAGCIQMPSCRVADSGDSAEAWKRIRANIEVAEQMGRDACAADRPDLIVLPEFAFQGPPLGLTAREWVELACCPVPGPITQPLQSLAREERIRIVGNQFESDPDWPGKFFNTSFLIDTNGEVVMRYRRINTTMSTSPHDIMSDYVPRYGIEGVFPVADTELGRLALLPCGEISVPEAVRAVVFRGAEIILHPTNESYSNIQEMSKVARAVENLVFVVSANVAGLAGADTTGTQWAGHSKVVDFKGELLSDAADSHDPLVIKAEIRLGDLRRARATVSPDNRLLFSRFEMYAPLYAQASFYPPDRMLHKGFTDDADTSAARNAAVANMMRSGVLSNDKWEALE